MASNQPQQAEYPPRPRSPAPLPPSAPDDAKQEEEIENWFANELNDSFRCFGCSPHNPHSLGLRLYRTRDARAATSLNATGTSDSGLVGRVPALGRERESFPGLVHGGVLATLIDDMAYWTVFVSHRTLALTKSMRVEYLAPASSRDELLLRSSAPRTSSRPSVIEVEVEVFARRRDKHTLLAKGTVEFVFPEHRQLRAVLGTSGVQLAARLASPPTASL